MPQIIQGLDDQDSIGFNFFKSVGKAAKGAAKGVAKVGKAVINNPVVKVVLPIVPAAVGQGPMFDLGAKVNPGVAALRSAGKSALSGNAKAVVSGGAAFVAPKGVPSALAVSAADRIVRMGSSAIPANRATAQGVVARTRFLAAKGDASAKAGLVLLQKTAGMRKRTTSAPFKPPALPRPKPPVKAKPKARPLVKALAKPMAKPAAPAQGWLVQATGALKGTIVKGGRWNASAAASAGVPGVLVYSTGKQRGQVVRGKRWMKAG